jgi:hypothetical protein
MHPRALSRLAEQNTSFSPGMRTEATSILTYVLNNTTPHDFHDALKRAINGPMVLPTDVENVLVSLRSIGLVTSAATAAAQDDTHRHCVRCHSQYLEMDNGLKACIISHDKPQVIEKPPKDGVVVLANFYPCCTTQTPLNFVPKNPHFVGRHTTQADNVDYNETNVIRCGPGTDDKVVPPPYSRDVQSS